MDTNFLSHLVLNFKAGCVKDHTDNWISVTTDPIILDAIFLSIITLNLKADVDLFRLLKFSSGDKEIINAEITNLLSKGVIELTDPLD